MLHAGAEKAAGPIDSEYHVLKVLASGAFGRVCLVRRKSDGKVLASKEIDYFAMSHKQRAQVVLEVNILRDLQHPNIVKYLGRYLDRTNHKLHILMEHCDAGDLGQTIKAHQTAGTRFTEFEIWRILSQLLQALNQCHTPGAGKSLVLHRDIKPENVFLDSSGSVKLGDFGLSTRISEAFSFAETYVGTPYYMSPEIVRGRSYCAKSDIWALGCLVYQLCNLEPPFRGSNILTLHDNITNGRYRRISSLYSPLLHELVGSMLHVDPNKRSSSASLLKHPAIKQQTEYMAKSHDLEKQQQALRDKQEQLQSMEAKLKCEAERLEQVQQALHEREASLQQRERLQNINNQYSVDSKLSGIQEALKHLHVDSSGTTRSSMSNPFLPLEQAIQDYYRSRRRPSYRKKPRDRCLESDSSPNIFLPADMRGLPRSSKSRRHRA